MWKHSEDSVGPQGWDKERGEGTLGRTCHPEICGRWGKDMWACWLSLSKAEKRPRGTLSMPCFWGQETSGKPGSRGRQRWESLRLLLTMGSLHYYLISTAISKLTSKIIRYSTSRPWTGKSGRPSEYKPIELQEDKDAHLNKHILGSRWGDKMQAQKYYGFERHDFQGKNKYK